MLGYLLIVAVLVYIGLALAMFVYSACREWSLFYCLKRYGVLGEAFVISLDKRTNKVDQYFVNYQFEFDGKIYENEQRISKKHFKILRETNRNVAISLLHKTPQNSRLAEGDSDNTFRAFTSYAAFAACILIPPLIPFAIICFIISTFTLLLGLSTPKNKNKSKRKNK